MDYIENEKEFRNFMERSGPFDFESQRSYLSRLNFLSKEGFKIDSSLLETRTILNSLRATANQRTRYNRDIDYPALGSAINKYREFLNSNPDVLEDIREIANENQIEKTEKDQLIKARVGQGKFRSDLIAMWGRCALSNVENIEFLVASHILPWRKSNNIERLDPYNGLLLQPNFDRLFDKGFISFNNAGQLILSKRLSQKDFENFGIIPDSRLIKVHPENIPYLERHRILFQEILLDE